jgi:DNA-binding MarR family transcriptional regulator
VLVLARQLRSTIQSGGLSAAKLSTIGQLYRAGPMTPTELAMREGVRLASLTRLLSELEDDGWLSREAHPSDGRRSVLSLTPIGRKRLVAAVLAADAPLADVISSNVNPDDLRVLLQACTLLERISDAMGGCTESASASQESAVRLESRSS